MKYYENVKKNFTKLENYDKIKNTEVNRVESGKHKKRINYTVMIVSDSPDGGIHPFYLGQMLLAPLLIIFWLNFPIMEAVNAAFSIGLRRSSTLIYCVHVPVMVCLMLWGQPLLAVVAGVFGMDERMANFCLVSAGACMFAGLVLLLHRYMPWLRFLW